MAVGGEDCDNDEDCQSTAGRQEPEVPGRRLSAFVPLHMQAHPQGLSNHPVTWTSAAKPSSIGSTRAMATEKTKQDRSSNTMSCKDWSSGWCIRGDECPLSHDGPPDDGLNGVDTEERRRPTSDERASRYSRRRSMRERSRSNDGEQRRGRGRGDRGDHDGWHSSPNRDNGLERHRRFHRKEDRGVGSTKRSSHYGTAGPIGARPSSSDGSWTRSSAMTTHAIGYNNQSPSVDRSWACRSSDHSRSSWGGSWGNSDDRWGSNGTQKPIVGIAWSGSSGWRDSGPGSGGWEKSSWGSHGSESDWAGREGGWRGGYGGNSGGGRTTAGNYQKDSSNGSANWKRRGSDDSWQRRGGSASKSRSPDRPSSAWPPKNPSPGPNPCTCTDERVLASDRFDDGEDVPLPGTTSTSKSSAAKPPKALESTCLAGPSMKPGMMLGLLQPSQALVPPAKATITPQPTLQALRVQIRPLAGQTGLATWDSVARVIPICTAGRQAVLAATAKR